MTDDTIEALRALSDRKEEERLGPKKIEIIDTDVSMIRDGYAQSYEKDNAVMTFVIGNVPLAVAVISLDLTREHAEMKKFIERWKRGSGVKVTIEIID